MVKAEDEMRRAAVQPRVQSVGDVRRKQGDDEKPRHEDPEEDPARDDEPREVGVKPQHDEGSSPQARGLW